MAQTITHKICQFFKTQNQIIFFFPDAVWLQNLFFLVDVSKYLTDFNLKIQAKFHIITCSTKLTIPLLVSTLRKVDENEDLTHFPTCKIKKET